MIEAICFCYLNGLLADLMFVSVLFDRSLSSNGCKLSIYVVINCMKMEWYEATVSVMFYKGKDKDKEYGKTKNKRRCAII